MILPRSLDRWLASELTTARSLKVVPEIAVKVNNYIELSLVSIVRQGAGTSGQSSPVTMGTPSVGTSWFGNPSIAGLSQ